VAAADVTVKRELAPAWSTDWITEAGKTKLAASGISPPRTAEPGSPGETPVRLGSVVCPLCGSSNTEEISHFGSTACKALHRCLDCSEPFDHVKEL
jgi:ring-1,2-phenylacetyl-CoA epoxidase subunit PaaD